VADRKAENQLVFISVIIATVMVSMDGGLMSMIAPSVEIDLNISPTTLSLISSMFTMTMAALILAGGTLGYADSCKRIPIY
jgi:hypothetical protein